MKFSRSGLVTIAAMLVGAGCALTLGGETATLPVSAGMGPNPTLPPEVHALLPTANVAPAIGWKNGAMPVAAPGLKVAALATGLEHPRWLYLLPNGDVLVAEASGPHFAQDFSGVKGMAADFIMKKAGAVVDPVGRLILLRQTPQGVQRFVFADGLASPMGMALVGNELFVADTDALIKFPYQPGDTKASAPPTHVLDLPGGPIDHHWTKTLLASTDGAKFYVGVGSNSNVGDNGMAAEEGRAAIWEIDRATLAHRIFASGLRNPVGLAWEPVSGALWTSVNERDELGSDLVPDYMTHVQDGGFYGWPYSYYGQHVDGRAPPPPRPDLVAKAIVPDYALGPHTASLGLAFSHAGVLTPAFAQGAFIGQHGSWNRNPRSGYKVIFVPFADGKPSGPPVDVLTGFLDTQGNAQGRPVGVAIDANNALLVADDVGNAVWRVAPGP
jgi:glucose/arabinose dehydrogenase